MHITPDETIFFENHITPLKAEDIVRKLSEKIPQRKYCINFANCRFIEVLTSSLLANALSRYEDSLVHIILPFESPFVDRKDRDAWFQYYVRTALIDSLMFHHRSISGRHKGNIYNDLIQQYPMDGDRSGYNHVLVKYMGRNDKLNVEDATAFGIKFRNSLKLARAVYGHFSPTDIDALTKLAFESLQNIYDHSAKSPFRDVRPVFSYLAINYRKSINNPPSASDHFVRYLTTLNDRINPSSFAGYLEVQVCDDGVGIPARYCQNMDVYWDSDHEMEANAFREALQTGSTTKLKTQDCQVRGDPGAGSYYIHNCIKRLQAFGIFRTGRRVAHFNSMDDDCEGFEVLPEVLGYMPGTVLTVIVPLTSASIQPDLFGTGF